MTGKLAGRVAIVTGGARGIGGQIAVALAAEGADVVALVEGTTVHLVAPRARSSAVATK